MWFEGQQVVRQKTLDTTTRMKRLLVLLGVAATTKKPASAGPSRPFELEDTASKAMDERLLTTRCRIRVQKEKRQEDRWRTPRSSWHK